MTEGTEGQDPSTVQPPAGTEEEAPASVTPPAGEGLTKEALEAELKKVRSEAAAHRRKLRDFEEQAKKREEAELTELELARKRAEDAEAALTKAEAARRAASLKADFSTVAMAQGLNPKATQAALSLAQITFDDNGNPLNVTEAIDALKAEHGYLFASPTPPPPGSTNAGAGSGQGQSVVLTAEEAMFAGMQGMTPEQYKQYATRK